MATSLGYTPPTPSYDPARAEVDDLVAALHDSGLLRVMAGGARTYPDALRPVLRSLDADTVRSLIALSGAFAHLDPQVSERVAAGVRDARAAAAEAASLPPEGPVRLWRRLRDPSTRRGLTAALAGLAALGAALREDDPSH